MSVAAVITAGGRIDGEFAAAIGTRVKALAPLNGTTMLTRTIRALREAGIQRVAVVGGEDVRLACAASVDRIVPESMSGAENVRRALRAWGELGSLLYTTSDLPFIAGDAVLQFLRAVPEQTLALPLAEWRDFTAKFPGAPPFGVTLGGERVVNGGMFVIPGAAIKAVEVLAMRFFEARKGLLRMAVLAGPTVLARFLLRKLSIGDLEERASRLVGVRARAIRHAPPELAYDVDVLAEYRYALERAS